MTMLLAHTYEQLSLTKRLGIAFPTSVSINSAICHLSPLRSDPEAEWTLQKGDAARIELGVHVDGYIAQVAHTLFAGASKEAPTTGRQADVMQAAYLASEAAVRLIKPGKSNWDVTDAIQKIAEEFECKPVEGMLTHQIQRNVLDGAKQIILNPTENQRKETEALVFEEGEAYSIDILISTGEGKPKALDTRTTIYKRNSEANYSLKMKASRAVFSDITKNYGTMAFTLRSFDDEKKGRLGILEPANHGLVSPYAVLYETKDAHVAHFMFTVLMMPSGPLKVTSFPWDQELVKSEKELTDEAIKDLLKEPVRSSKKSKKKVLVLSLMFCVIETY